MKNRIIINSRNRTSQFDSPCDYKMKFLYPIEKGIYCLNYCYFPNTMLTISDNNNWFKVSYGTTTLKVTVVNGDYNTQTNLVNAVNTAISSITSNYITASLVNANYIRFSATNSNTINIDFSESNIAHILGLSKQVYTFNTNFTSQGIINLSPLMAINILINNQGNIRNNDSLSYTFRIPITANKEEYICYEPSENFYQYLEFTNDQSSITVKVVNDFFQTIDTVGVDWWIVLEKQ